MEYGNNVATIFMIMVYIGLFALYIMFIVQIWRACNAVIDIKDQLKDMGYRDTTRYIAEINSNKISEGDQEEAQKIINS